MNSQIQAPSFEETMKAIKKEDKFYDIEFLKSTLEAIKADLGDLAMWSVYNGDDGVDMISSVQEVMETLSKYLLERTK